MRAQFFSVAIVVFALAMMAPAGDCGSQAGEIAQERGVDLTKSADPAIQAAGGSSDAVEREKEAETNEVEALSAENVAKGSGIEFGAIDRAISLRPANAGLRLEKAALLIAAGRTKDAEVSSGEGFYLVKQEWQGMPATPSDEGVSEPAENWAFRNEYVGALARVRLAAPPSSDARKRVEQEMCRNYSDNLLQSIRAGFPTCP